MNISVIIPTFNRAHFVLKAIKSVQCQSSKIKEIIVVDDGSTDKTKELLKNENIRYIYQENQGVSKARNTGIKAASYDWIAFLDSDDIWHENKIEEHISLHVNNPDLLASYTNEVWIRNAKTIKLKNHQQKEEPSFLNSLSLCKIGVSTFFSHKKIFEDIGLFDKDLRVCEDYDLWLRILLKYEIKLINKQLITKYAGHKNQLSFETPFIDIYRIKALEKHLNTQYKKEVKDEIKYKTEILLKGAKKHNNQKIINYFEKKLNAVELYCGIGGFSKACEDLSIEIVKAYDQNDFAIDTYNANFSHQATKFNLEKFDETHLENIDFLWMSPPCQPYTRKGTQQELKDSRTDSFKTILNAILEKPPLHVGLENVEGFKDSSGRELLVKTLRNAGYFISETLLCPSELGIPNRRMRYYLAASLKPLKPIQKSFTCKELKEFIKEPNEPFLVPKDKLEKFKDGFRIINPEDKNAYSTCFTSSYSKSWMHSGAYLTCKDGVRLFEPNEIASLMGFEDDFIFPKKLTKRQAYKLIGNSLSVYVLKVILTQFDLD